MNGSFYGFWSIASKEFMHLRRDPTTLVIALMIPMIQITMFGFAIDFDIRHISSVVVDLDRTRESRAYVDSLKNTEYIDVTGYLQTPDQAEEALRRGTARVAIIIPPDFARRSVPGSNPAVRVLIDGSDSQVAIRARSAFIAPPSRPAPGAVEARIDMMFNPDMRTPVFTIPGLVGVILQLVTVSLTAFSLVREREQGTLEQLMVSPVGRLGLMLGKILPYACLAMFEVIAVLLVGRIIFDVHVVGSILLLFLLSGPFIVAGLSLGLLISTVAQNQSQAMQMTMLISMPSILMSGFVFPRETMPGPLYILSRFIPVSYYLDIIRGVVVRGAGFSELLTPLLWLIVIAALLLALATARFHKSSV